MRMLITLISFFLSSFVMAKTTHIIDLGQVETQQDFHEVLAVSLDFPDYYGHNLDALWDVLATQDLRDTVIEFHSARRFFDHNSPQFLKALHEILDDLQEHNDGLTFRFILD